MFGETGRGYPYCLFVFGGRPLTNARAHARESTYRAMAQVVNPELQGLNVNVFRQSDIEASVADQMDAAIARYRSLDSPMHAWYSHGNA